MIEGPPDFTNVRFDFSEAHFLDHSIWHCSGQPGGRLRHLRYRWTFHWRSILLSNTTCRVGWHEPVTMWRGCGANARAIQGCGVCLKRL